MKTLREKGKQQANRSFYLFNQRENEETRLKTNWIEVSFSIAYVHVVNGRKKKQHSESSQFESNAANTT